MRATDGIVGDRRRCSGALAAQNVLDREWDFPCHPNCSHRYGHRATTVRTEPDADTSPRPTDSAEPAPAGALACRWGQPCGGRVGAVPFADFGLPGADNFIPRSLSGSLRSGAGLTGPTPMPRANGVPVNAATDGPGER